MPTPSGDITSTETWSQPANSAEELDAVIDAAIAEADAEEAENDLPELS